MIGIGAVALVSAVSMGQHCGYGGGYGYATTYQNYYAYPTYSYGYNYGYQQPYQQKVITKYVAVQPYVDYTALAGDYIRAEKQLEAQAAQDKAVQDQIGRLATTVEQLTRVAQQPAPQPQQVIVQQPAPQVQAAPQQSVYAPQPAPQQPTAYYAPSKPLPAAVPPKASPYPQLQSPALAPAPPSVPLIGGPTTADTSEALAVLNRCASCHTAPTAKGGMTIWSSPGQLAQLTTDDLDSIDEAVSAGRMPPNQPLNLAEFRALHDWIRAGAQPPTVAGAQPAAPLRRNPF